VNSQEDIKQFQWANYFDLIDLTDEKWVQDSQDLFLMSMIQLLLQVLQTNQACKKKNYLVSSFHRDLEDEFLVGHIITSKQQILL